MKLIPLTDEHINDGIAGDCTACPVALALSDACVHASSVQPSEINFGGDDGDDEDYDVRYTSADLSNWMFDFDGGKHCEPVTIVLLSDEVTTLAEYQEALRS